MPRLQLHLLKGSCWTEDLQRFTWFAFYDIRFDWLSLNTSNTHRLFPDHWGYVFQRTNSRNASVKVHPSSESRPPARTPTLTHLTQSSSSSASFTQLHSVALASCGRAEYFMSRIMVWHSGTISGRSCFVLSCVLATSFKPCHNSHSSSQSNLNRVRGGDGDTERPHTQTHTYCGCKQKADSEEGLKTMPVASHTSLSSVCM